MSDESTDRGEAEAESIDVVPVVRRRRRVQASGSDPSADGPGQRSGGGEGGPPRSPEARPRQTAGGRPPAAPDDEYVLLPRDTSAGRKVITVLFAVALLLGVVLGGSLLWASRQINPPGPQGALIERLTVPKGATVTKISAILAEQRVIANQRVFTLYADIKGAGGWKAGDYVGFHENSSFDEAIAVLDKGPVAPKAKVVRITEGSRLVDALAAIAEQTGTVTVEQLQAALDSGAVQSAYKPADVSNWEGLLFPDTYQFAEDDSAEVILQKMVTKMDSVLDGLGYQRAEALAGRSAYELITIASLIERETGQGPEERGKISRVISNRLDAGEPLGIDASVLYGLGRRNGGLSKADLERDTPYNTRKVKGLPPTPIALPGEASLKAAMEPSPGDWKYYVLVSNDPPTHFFTSSYKEFLKQKADAQRRGVF